MAESYLRFFLKKSLKNGLSVLFQKNFAIIFLFGILLQYYISPSTQPKMSVSFWINGIKTVMGIGVVALLVKNYRFIYCVVVMLPRDIRGAWRFSRVLKRIRWADKRNLTVTKIFDLYADRNPNKICFYYEDEQWTFKQVQDMSNQVGNYFADKGFAKGDVVALFMENRPEYVIVWMGLNKIGVCAALVNYNLRLQTLLHSFEVVKAKAVIYGNELSEAMQELMEVENLLSTIPLYCSGHKNGPILKGVLDFDSEISNASRSTPKRLRDMTINDSLFYVYTSGTTGMPKLLKKFNLLSVLEVEKSGIA
ncbi:Long-chain fatty acid transport protein 4 [Folsomia candida]|uniref:Long-chain-fatty-acid--CoA ligase n=1 Tax=Folsomia candida TaxID=158441 RepID=A0A226E2U9_FOLCA|nr:Long-chain fatty acid transport protein 4 [Folsomia candida]